MRAMEKKQLQNGIVNFVQGVRADLSTAPRSEITPQFYNTRGYLVTFQRQLLNNLYVESGLVQTMIDQPVEDAFRGDIKINSSELDDDDIDEIEKKFRTLHALDIIKDAFKWCRLFGGGGIILNIYGQEPTKPLDIESIKEGARLEFYAADRWELANSPYTVNPTLSDLAGLQKGINFNFYGQDIHPSRVLILKGKTPPSLKRLQLAGWGMSEIERLVAPLNKFDKNQNVIYELLDESKLDVYSIQDYNVSLMAGQEDAIRKRVECTNMLKSYLNALVLDKEDTFDQKNMNFSGMSELLEQARLDVASALKIPVTKLFGMSSAGFNSGEDDLENYNSMIERDVRTPAKDVLITIYQIISASVLGMIPQDLDIEFPSLRVAKENEIQERKNMSFARGKEMYEMGLMTKGELYDYLQENEIITQKLKIKGSKEYNDASMGEETSSRGSTFGNPDEISIHAGIRETDNKGMRDSEDQ